jgi:hypothetical protein
LLPVDMDGSSYPPQGAKEIYLENSDSSTTSTLLYMYRAKYNFSARTAGTVTVDPRISITVAQYSNKTCTNTQKCVPQPPHTGTVQMQTPTPGSTLSGNTETFTWSAGSGANAYWLDVGSAPGGNNYYQSGNLGNVLFTTGNTLPADGSQIYVTLYSLVNGQWLYNQYVYTSGP